MDDDGDILASFKGNILSFQKSWFLDFAYVTHVCTKKDYFDSLNDKLASKLSLDCIVWRIWFMFQRCGRI